jgi:GntR family transcriptional regulator
VKYVEVRNYLRGLATHELKAGDPLPSERELSERFGVARMTVRQAVDGLVVEGILERVQGRGTFVAQPKFDLQMRLTSFDQEMHRRNLKPSSQMLSADVREPPADVIQALDLEPGDECFYIYRLRMAEGTPMCLESDWVPRQVVPDFFTPSPPPSIYEALTGRGKAPQWGEDTIDADTASDEEAQALQISPKSAVLRIARRTFHEDEAVVFTRSVYRADRYTLWVPVTAPGAAVVPGSKALGGVK